MSDQRLEPTVGDPLDDVVDRIVRTTALDRATGRRLVEEVVDALREPLDDLLRRRHRELQAAGWANPAIYARLQIEAAARPVAAPALTERQVRRAIYG